MGDGTLYTDDTLNHQSVKPGIGKFTQALHHKQTEMYVDSALAFIAVWPGRIPSAKVNGESVMNGSC